MNYLTEPNEEALNHLLEEKAFDQLTKEEQAIILADMPEERYRQLQKMTKDARSVLSSMDDLTPRESIRIHVRRQMLKEPAKTSSARKKIFRSTLVQIAAAVALLVIGIQLTTRTSKALIPGNPSDSQFVDSTSTDSAIQHKSTPNEDTVIILGKVRETAMIREERGERRDRVAERRETAVLREVKGEKRYRFTERRETAMLREMMGLS